MAIDSFLSQRFSFTQGLSQALTSLFRDNKTREAQSDHVSLKPDLTVATKQSDSINLSSAMEFKQTIAQFRQQTVQSELNVSFRFSSVSSSSKSLSEAGDNNLTEKSAIDIQLDGDISLILRSISKNEEEYNSLKANFNKMFTMTQASFSSRGNSGVVSAENTELSEVPDEIPQNGKPMTLAQMRIVKENSIQLNLNFQQTISKNSTSISLEALGIKEIDPLVLDLSGEGINLTEAGKGAIFDITADGNLDSTAWVKGNTAMLCYDRNGNCRIDDGSELFGDQNGASDGFAELAKYDQNGDNKIDISDPIFKKLKLYRDLNGDGRISENELSTLPELGIKQLNLDFVRTNQKIKGNSLIMSGSFQREDGTSGQLADVLFGYRKI